MVMCESLEPLLDATISALARLDLQELCAIEEVCEALHCQDASAQAALLPVRDPSSSFAAALSLPERLSAKQLLLRRMLQQTQLGLNLLSRGKGCISVNSGSFASNRMYGW